MEGQELGRRSFAGRRMLFVFGGVEIEDLAPLSRARVNGAQVFAAFHFPDGRDHAVFLHGLIGYLFRLSRRRRILRFRHCSLAFRHRNSLVDSCFAFWDFVEGFWHSHKADV